MKKITLFLLNFLFLSLLMAQPTDETEKREMEREVKTSGNYLYGEAVENTLDGAQKAATLALITEINQEIGKRSDWKLGKEVSPSSVLQRAELIDLMRGNKYRTIAYIEKDKIETLFDSKIKEEVKERSKKETEVIIEEVPESVFAETKRIEEGAKATEERKKAEVQNIEEAVAIEQVEEVVKKEKTYYYNSNDLLGQIVKAPSVREINKLLADNKKNGKAVYGTMETMTHPENVYIVVYKKTGEIVAILDKGPQNSRRDLISGEMKDKNIYQDHQIVWFQIY